MNRKLINLIFLILSISLLINISNLIAIEFFDINNQFTSIMYVTLFTLPFNIIYTVGFNYYYGKYIEYFHYSFLVLLYISFNIILSIIFQIFYFNKYLNINTFFGLFLIFI